MRRLGIALIVLASLGAFALAWLSAFVDWPHVFHDPQVGALMSWMTLIGAGFGGAFLLDWRSE